MKLTIEISTYDLKRLTEDYGQSLCLELPVYDGENKAKKIGELEVYQNPYSWNADPKERKKQLQELDKQKEAIEKSMIADVAIKYPVIHTLKFRVIKIEPSDSKQY